MPRDLKGQYFKKIEWGVICLLLYAYKENTLNGEINTKNVYISASNNTNF
jgi:hypothetical protein